MEADIKAWVDSMVNVNKRTSFYFLATKFISRRIIKLAAVILEEAAKRAPYETGALRESGEVSVIAGKASGLDTYVKITGGTGQTTPTAQILKSSISKGAGMIEMSIHFDRVEKGMDLALWAHEELLYYVKRPKSGSQIGAWHATHYRTGPKYLENAFKIYKADIPRQVKKGLLEATTAYNRKNKTRARRR
jgi:hypothetical protein